MTAINQIPNPYIVGNPIKTRKMFYGREDEFEFIERKLARGSKSHLIVLCGERRSGKTSILFQILNGHMGPDYIPALVDMQTLAGLSSDAEFFDKFASEIIKSLPARELALRDYDFYSKTNSPYSVFDCLLHDIHILYPCQTILFLIDEYELIDSKIDEGGINANFVRFLAGVLESERRISFVFTGSKRLEDQEAAHWRILLGKSIYRNISFLSRGDTERLIREPVKDHITFEQSVVDRIYELTAGHPFYTQVVCQNIIDHLNESEVLCVDATVLERIVDEILENPLPQMIYFWNGLNYREKIVLSLLADLLHRSADAMDPQTFRKKARRKEYDIRTSLKAVHTTMEALFHASVLKKTSRKYSFQMGIYHLWVKRDHSIWRVMKESGQLILDEPGLNEPDVSDLPHASETGGRPARQIRWLSVAAMIALLAAGSSMLVGHRFAATDLDGPARPAAGATHAALSTPFELPLPAPLLNDSIDMFFRSVESQREHPVEAERSDPVVKKARPRVSPAGTRRTASVSPVNQRSRAANALKLLTRTRGEVNRLVRDSLSISLAALAEQKEIEAQHHYRRREYDAASELFTSARLLYQSAMEQSRRYARKMDARAQALQSKLGALHQTSTVNFEDLSLFDQAISAEEEGTRQLSEGNSPAAIEQYQIAIALYERSYRLHRNRTGMVESLLSGYRHAIEKEDLSMMAALHARFTSESETRWRQFFTSVNQLSMEIAPVQIRFQDTTASTTAAVRFDFDGAGGAGDWLRWEIHFEETERGWLIADIIDQGL